MSKTLKFKDLTENGLELTKQEALQLQPHISKISQHGADGLNNVEFEKGPSATAEQKQHNTGQANNIQTSTGFETKAKEPAKKITKKDLKEDPTLAERGLKVGDEFPPIVEPEQETKSLTGFVITQEYLDANPGLVDNGFKVGDTVCVITQEDLDSNPEWVEEGVVVGDTIGVHQEENQPQ